MQKKRIFDQTIFFFNFWLRNHSSHFTQTVAFFFTRPIFIKLKFFKKFRRKFRKFLRKKKAFVYFFCKANFLIHEKYKNARMGKGKGSPLKWVYKPVLSKPFAVIRNFNHLKARTILYYFQKYLNKKSYMCRL